MRHFSLKQFRDGGDQKTEASPETRDHRRGVGVETGLASIGRDRTVW